MGKMQREIGGDFVDFEEFWSIRNWWLYRMAHTPRPLEEKMTLFWHNHFATSAYKVDSARRMWNQNETLRRHSLGSFRTLLQQIARAPAMLIWLDGASNHAGAPNENFAREVMELFTLGRGNGYTETDIKEAARCFTGWRWANTPSNFVYDPNNHDDGEKTVLGQTGNWHADDVIDILVRHQSTAKRITSPAPPSRRTRGLPHGPRSVQSAQRQRLDGRPRLDQLAHSFGARQLRLNSGRRDEPPRFFARHCARP